MNANKLAWNLGTEWEENEFYNFTCYLYLLALNYGENYGAKQLEVKNYAFKRVL